MAKPFLILRVVAIPLALLLLAVLPTQIIERAPSLCLFKNLFGAACLGCGMTRALSLLLHGDVSAGLDHNKLVIAVLLLAGAALFRDLIVLRRGALRGSELR